RPSTTTAVSSTGRFLKLTIRGIWGTISVDSSANWRKPMPQLTLEMPRQHIADFCRRHHIRKLALFGSILRPDFRLDSDIDVLVDLDQDRVLSLALVQLCQILGEAASRVSAPRRQQHPEVPWTQITALRNRLIHGYDTIDLDILWQILTGDLPPLITALANIVSPKNP